MICKLCIEIYIIFIVMADIKQLYETLNHTSNNGVDGYHVEKKYLDPQKMKQQRMYSEAKSTLERPTNVSKKKSFIDEVQKYAAKFPSPCHYQLTIDLDKSSKTKQAIPATHRKTIFDDIQEQNNKYGYPGAGSYFKMSLNVDKKDMKSNINRSQSPSYAQASMRNSLECPGVGNYNAYRCTLEKKGVKIVQEKSKPQKQIHFPSVGTYEPIQYDTFADKTKFKKIKGKSQFAKQQRFKTKKDKTIPFYNILSDWGMKDKRHKNDILTKISQIHKSVYY